MNAILQFSLTVFPFLFFGFLFTAILLNRGPEMPPLSFTAPSPLPAVQNYDETEGTLIASFPAVPVYPTATVIKSRRIFNPAGETTGYSALWEIPGRITFNQLVAWYSAQLTKSGWILDPAEANDPAGTVHYLTASRQDLRSEWSLEPGVGREADTFEVIVTIRTNDH